jgi:hypothetical protein
VRISQGDLKISPTLTSRPPRLASQPRVGGIGALLARVRTAPESVKRRLRPVLVWLVRAAVAVPGGRRVARSVLRQMPESGSWLLRRYEIYRQMAVVSDPDRRGPTTIAGADDLSREETIQFLWLETALRSRR